MHQKHLLRFIKSKLKREPDEIVIFRDGKFLTLQVWGTVFSIHWSKNSLNKSPLFGRQLRLIR